MIDLNVVMKVEFLLNLMKIGNISGGVPIYVVNVSLKALFNRRALAH